MWFMREWKDYQIRYQVPVNPLTAVSGTIPRQIKNSKNLQDEEVRNMSPEFFCEYMSEEL